MCYDADLCNPLTYTEEAEREVNVKHICGSLTESFVNDKIIEMTENEVGHYQFAIINHVDFGGDSRRLGYHRRGKGMCRGSLRIKYHFE